MKKLGTHNSLSYLPCQWYLRPLAWVGKCQSLTLEKQYAKGVRWFDIRVKYVDGEPLSGHGLLTYNVNIDTVLSFLNNRNDKCIVRIYLENSKFNPTKYFKYFENDVKAWVEKYKNIQFTEGGCRYQYRKILPDPINPQDCYWKKGKGFPYPKGFAKRHNAANHKNDNTEKYSIYDFIEIGL